MSISSFSGISVMSLQEGIAATAPPVRAFVNRQRELGELRAALQSAIGGRGSLCLLSGEPGIGKTRLATELGVEASTQGVPVLWGRCWEGGGAPAFWPWVQLLRAQLRDRDPHVLIAQLGTAAAHIARVVPELAEALGEGDRPIHPMLGSDSESEHDRFYLFDAITTFLAQIAAEHGLLVIFDDLHAADLPSLLLLQFVAKELHEARLMVLGTFRDAEARRSAEHAELLLSIAREGAHLPLHGLPERDVARLIGGGGDFSPLVVTELHRLTDGNPFFIGEILRSGAAQIGTRGGEPGAISPMLARAIPSGVRESVRQRLTSLPEKDYDVLSVAAVAGREFSVPLLQAVCERSVDQILDVLDRALDDGVVHRLGQVLGGFRFTHALFREVLYDDLPMARRLALHRQVGEEVERWGGGHPEAHLTELAYHFFEAASLRDVVDKAIDYAERAAAQASARLAYEDAITQHTRALQLLELQGIPNPSLRCDILLGLGSAQGKVGLHSRARETFLRAGALARSLGSGERLARTALRFGTESLIVEPFESGTVGGVDEEFVRLCDDALAALPPEDSALRARLLGRLAVALHWSPNSQERREQLSREAVEMAERVGDVEALIAVLNTRCYAAWGPDNLEVRLDAATRMVELAESVDHMDDALAGRLWLVFCRLELGDIAAADAHLARIEPLAKELRQPLSRWYVSLARAMRTMMAGRLAEGEELVQQTLALGQSAENKLAPTMFGGQMFRLWAERGQLAELETAMQGILGATGALPAARAGLAFVLCECGKLDEARALFEELASGDFSHIPREVSWVFAITVLAMVSAALGDAKRAQTLHELLLPFGDRLVVLGPPPMACWGPVAYYLGITAATARRFDEAEAHFRQAIDVSRRIEAPTFRAQAEVEYARTLLDRGIEDDREKARTLAEESMQTAAKLGLAALEARARTLIDRATVLASTIPRQTIIAADERRPPSEPDRFSRDGRNWEIVFEGKGTRLPDSKGLGYIAALLRHAGDEIPVLDLAAEVDGTAGSAERSRLVSLREELEEAERWSDTGRIARLRDELDRLTGQVAGTYGVRRGRAAVGDAERARKAVTGRIREAIKRIAERDRALAKHLDNSLRTGMLCSYRPDRARNWCL